MRTKTRRHTAVLAVLVGLTTLGLLAALPGCGGDEPEDKGGTSGQTNGGADTPPAVQGEAMVVFVGGTMEPVMQYLADEYEKEAGVRLVINKSGSGELLTQIESGQHADLYVSHDPYLRVLMERNLGLDGWLIAEVTPAIIVSKRSEHADEINSVADLAKPGVRIVLTDPDHSTMGYMHKAIFENAGVNFEQVIQEGTRQDPMKVVRTRGGGAAALKVEADEVDAGMVWNAVAHKVRDKVKVVKIAPNHLPREGADAVTSATGKTYEIHQIKVTLAVVRATDQLDAAQQFAEWVADPDNETARKAFEDYGFTTVRPVKLYDDGEKVAD